MSPLLPGAPPLLDVQEAEYEVMGLPLSFGAATETTISVFPLATDGCAGVSGAAAGTTGDDGTDAAPVPMTLVAVTVQVYVRPFVRPLTEIGEVKPMLLPNAPPLLEVHEAS